MRLNPLIQSTADTLIDLVHLNQVSIVDVLRNRYEWDLIYTAVGSMLIAVNPYRDIEHSFSVPLLPLIYQPFVRIVLTWYSGTQCAALSVSIVVRVGRYVSSHFRRGRSGMAGPASCKF